MLQAAHDYIRDNKPGRTEIWICSDIRENDWSPESARWESLRESFLEFPQGVRFDLLSYSSPAPENISIRVTDLRRQQADDGAELLISLRLAREGAADSRISVPVQFEIDGARSEVTVEMDGPQFELRDHRIPLDRSRERGWGRVSIPADANPADNDFYFVFDRPVPRRTILVADDPQVARPLELAATISADPSAPGSVETFEPQQLVNVDWEGLSLVLWQAPLPEGEAARLIEAFVDRGGQVIFFPPRVDTGKPFAGVRWQAWTEKPDEIGVENWRSDEDLLAHTQSGAALPVGQLAIRKYAGIDGEYTTLASLRGGEPLLVRAPSTRGGVYFCATTPAAGDSSLASQGVVLYVLVQRALAAGAAVLSNTRQLDAGEATESESAAWQRVIGDELALSTEYAFQRGVYVSGDRLIAVNRPAEEDQTRLVGDARVADLFHGLDFVRVDEQAGSLGSLIREIWRLFLFSMIGALIVEAALCLPKLVRPMLPAAPAVGFGEGGKA